MPSQSPSSSPLASSPLVYMLIMTSYGLGYPSGQLGSAVPPGSPPSFLCTPSLLAGKATWGALKALTLCKYCSVITKTSLCYQHCSQQNPKHSPIQDTRKKIDSTPAKISPDFSVAVVLYLHLQPSSAQSSGSSYGENKVWSQKNAKPLKPLESEDK